MENLGAAVRLNSECRTVAKSVDVSLRHGEDSAVKARVSSGKVEITSGRESYGMFGGLNCGERPVSLKLSLHHSRLTIRAEAFNKRGNGSKRQRVQSRSVCA